MKLWWGVRRQHDFRMDNAALVRRSKTLIFLYFQKLRYLTSAFQRPGFQEMLSEIEAGKIGTVIVKDMSRLGRDYLKVGFYTELHWTRA